MINFSAITAPLLFRFQKLQKPANVDKSFILIDSSNGANGGQFEFTGAASIGPPDFFQALKPPWICATGLRPMRCAVCAASAERKPPAQKNTNFLSWANIGLWYGLCGSIQNSSIPRGQWKAPGTRPSRSSSRTSRTSTSTISSRPASLTASSTGRVSISRSAASHKVLYPVVIACDMFLSLEHHAGRGPPCTQAARLKPASHAGNIRRKQRPETHDRPHPSRPRRLRPVRRCLDRLFDRHRAVGERAHRPQRPHEPLSRRMDGAPARARHAHGRCPGDGGPPKWGGVLCLNQSDCHRRRAYASAVKRRNHDRHVAITLWGHALARPVGSQNDGADCHFRVRVFQVRLVVPAFQLFRHHGGAAPPPDQKDTPAAQAFAHRAARLCADAGRHFNRGQRAFFFALGYLGWFVGPVPFALSTAGIMIVLWQRQFASEARKAFGPVENGIAAATKPVAAKPSPSRRRSPPRSAPPTTSREP